MRGGELLAALAVGWCVWACATDVAREREGRWRADWNERVDASASLWSNPCGDPEFDAWADGFLAPCDPEARIGHDECAQRRRWVVARSEQCAVWQDYLLRNHGKRERRDDVAEPPTRVE